MKIGFDAKRLFCNFTGLGNYSRGLVRHLQEHFPQHHYFLFTPKITLNKQTDEFLNYPIITTKKSFAFSLWRSFFIHQKINKLKLSIYHGLAGELPFSTIKQPIKQVVTIHDLIFRHRPSDYSLFDRKIYDYKAKLACKKADQIIAISEYTKKDIMQSYDINANKISVVYQSCNSQFYDPCSVYQKQAVSSKYNLPDVFLLSVGSINERKNLLKTIKAVEQINKVPLVVAGNGNGLYEKKVKAYVKEREIEHLVFFLDFVDFKDLPAIYQLAKCLVYPSSFEGFGIPIIEAFASKIPVITAKNSSLSEVGGKAAYYLESVSSNSLKEHIEFILNNNKENHKRIKLGKQQLAKFGPKKNILKLMDIYEQL